MCVEFLFGDLNSGICLQHHTLQIFNTYKVTIASRMRNGEERLI